VPDAKPKNIISQRAYLLVNREQSKNIESLPSFKPVSFQAEGTAAAVAPSVTQKLQS